MRSVSSLCRENVICPPFCLPLYGIVIAMPHAFEGTTLALQHYYDIVGVSKTLPLLTVYQADEQPFGRRMAIWMSDDAKLNTSDEIRTRLENVLIENQSLNNPYTLRVIDYGSSEGHTFVVTDPPPQITLRSWLIAHGPIAPWQALRLLEQLTAVVLDAHKNHLSHLCITSDRIFLSHTDRFDIVLGPLGIALSRDELRSLSNVPLTPDLMRHLPPWAFHTTTQDHDENLLTPNITPKNTDSENSNTGNTDSENSNTGNTDSENSNIGNTDSENSNAENTDSENSNTENTDSENSNAKKNDIGVEKVETVHKSNTSHTIKNFDEDVYNVAAVIYESLCGAHPYFDNESCVSPVALELLQSEPITLSKRVELDKSLSDAVMQTLTTPKADSLPEFLARFAAACSPDDRKYAQTAEKQWLDTPSATAPRKKRLRPSIKMKHPLVWLSAIVALIVCLTAALTWKIARYRAPVDLFAIPEIIPAATHGIDLVIHPKHHQSDATLYLVSMDDGSLIRLGNLPYIYRQQAPGVKLRFLIADDAGHSLQLPVTVKSDSDIMLVSVDTPW